MIALSQPSLSQPSLSQPSAPGGSLQDLLRLLTLWFRHGHLPAVDAAVKRGLDGDDASAPGVALQTWLEVTPQVIARLHSPHPRVRAAVLRLLARVAAEHPHGLIYPLAVAAKSAIPLQAGALTPHAPPVHLPRTCARTSL